MPARVPQVMSGGDDLWQGWRRSWHTYAESVSESRFWDLGWLTGALAWAVAGFATFSQSFTDRPSPLWFVLWGLYGAGFGSFGLWGHRMRGATRHLMLVGLIVLGVASVAWAPNGGFNTVLLVVTAVMVADDWPVWLGLAVLVGQSVIIGFSLHAGDRGWDIASVVSAIVSFFALQLFAFLLVIALRDVERARAAAARAHEEVAAAHAELQQAQSRLLEASRSDERLRIARELHDRVGHQLTALAVTLEAASHEATGPVADRVRTCRNLSKNLLAEVREVVAALRTDRVDLHAELAALAGRLARPSVHVDVADDVGGLTPAQAGALVRCAQECLTNTARHSTAENLWIAVEEHDGAVTLTARDDGAGAAGPVAGHGLLGMRERFEALGGVVSWSSAPGDGFHVEGTIPVVRSLALADIGPEALR